MIAPSVVLFDLDDTLCDYSGARVIRLRQAFSAALLRSGIGDVNLDDLVHESIAIHPHGSDHFPTLLSRHGVQDPALAAEARRWYHHNRFLGLEMYPGSRDVLAAVRSQPGIRAIGLVTNGPADVQRDKIALLDLWPLIDFAVISGEFGIEKPDPRIFAEALRLGRASPAEAVYIGDSPEFDMEGAHASGIARIWVNRAGSPWPRPTPEPAIQIREIDEVVPLLIR